MASLKELLAAKAAKAAPTPAPAAEEKPRVIIARADSPAPAKPQPTPLADEPRQLGATTRGTDVPFEFPSEKDSEAAKTWLQVRQLPETKLGIAMDPSGETTSHAWLAVESPDDPGKLLFLFRLPLLTPKSSSAEPY